MSSLVANKPCQNNHLPDCPDCCCLPGLSPALPQWETPGSLCLRSAGPERNMLPAPAIVSHHPSLLPDPLNCNCWCTREAFKSVSLPVLACTEECKCLALSIKSWRGSTRKSRTRIFNTHIKHTVHQWTDLSLLYKEHLYSCYSWHDIFNVLSLESHTIYKHLTIQQLICIMATRLRLLLLHCKHPVSNRI